MIILASEECFWPLTASMTSEVKNKYAYYIWQDICNKLIEVKIFVGCMVSWPNRHPWIINKIYLIKMQRRRENNATSERISIVAYYKICG